MRNGVGSLLVGSLGGLAFLRLDYFLGCPILYSVFCIPYCALYMRVCVYVRGEQCCVALLRGRNGGWCWCVCWCCVALMQQSRTAVRSFFLGSCLFLLCLLSIVPNSACREPSQGWEGGGSEVKEGFPFYFLFLFSYFVCRCVVVSYALLVVHDLASSSLSSSAPCRWSRAPSYKGLPSRPLWPPLSVFVEFFLFPHFLFPF